MMETKFRLYLVSLGLFTIGEVSETKDDISILISNVSTPALRDFDKIKFARDGNYIVTLSKKNVIFGF